MFSFSIEGFICITKNKTPKKKEMRQKVLKKKSDKIYSVNLHLTMEYSNVF